MWKTLLTGSWSPIVITALALAGMVLGWQVWALAPALVVVLIVGMVSMAIGARGKELEQASYRLRQLSGYFVRRFTGSSSLSIFAIINSLFRTEDPKLWDWARACDMAQRIFDTWCDGFIDRIESDIRTKSFSLYLRTYLNELWLLNNHHYEFVEQFYEIAENVEVPRETLDQYRRLAMEYNSFVQDFRDVIAGLRKVSGTEIEPPSVKFAKELSAGK